MRLKPILGLICFCATVAMVATFGAREATALEARDEELTRVVLRAEAVCAGSRILLSDAAVLRGETENVLALALLDLGPAPAPGKTTVLTASTVRAILGAHKVAVEGGETVRVTAALRLIPGRELAAAAEQAVARVLRVPEDFESQVEAVVPNDALARPGDYLLTVVPPSDAHLPGRRTVAVHLEQNGNKTVCALVNLRVRMFGRVPTAARELRPGEAFDDGAWAWERREWTSALPAEAPNPEQWRGMTIRQPLRAGQVLEARMFKASPLVRKNEMVSVLLEDNYLRIEGRGTALADAAGNEPVAVLVEGADRPVIGRASGPGRVTVR